MKTNIRVNNTIHELELDQRVTLLDALRDVLGLTGTKKGCDQGACGACTVIIDGQRVLSCLTLAAACEGKHVITIEGLAKADEPHPMQAAFLHCDGLQCGYCRGSERGRARYRRAVRGTTRFHDAYWNKGCRGTFHRRYGGCDRQRGLSRDGHAVRSLPISIEKVLGQGSSNPRSSSSLEVIAGETGRWGHEAA